MNIKKISMGLLFLILALVIVPGASAYSGFLAAHPTSNPTPEVCGGCHPANGVSCTDCHSNPFTLTINANPTTVTAGTPSSVTFTVTRKNSAQTVSTATVSLTGVATGTGTTSSTGIAAISVTATSPGSITATASKTGYTNGIRTLTASAPAPVLTTITVTPPNASVLVGGTQAFAAAPKDQNGNPIAATITWASSNSSVGTINAAGTFTASAAGTTTIRATSGSVSGTATVTVTASAPVPVLTTITVTPSNASVLVGGTQAFAAAPKDQNGNPIAATITWASSNSSVGTINAAGTFTASAAGTTTIRATSGSVSGTATVAVTAAPTGSFSVIFIVTDKRTGKPIHDAKISLDGITKKSDDDGKVKFRNVVSGIHSYKISKEHYLTITGSINVTKETKVSVKLVRGKVVNHHEERDD